MSTAESRRHPPGRGWAIARIVLGMGQTFGAVFSFVLIFKTGINQWSLTAAVLTCLLTTVSVLLFGGLGPLFRRRP